MKMFSVLLCLIGLFAYQPQASAQEAPRLLVVVFGDELTGNQYLPVDKRYDAQLEKKLRDVGFIVDVRNDTLVESTTATALKKIDSIISLSPDVVILQVGETDIRRGLDANTISGNINLMIQTLKDKNIYVILMGTRPPPNRGAGYASQIDNMFYNLSSRAQLYGYTLGNISGHEDMTIGDGYRPNAKGIASMVEGTYRLVDAGLRWRLEVINHMLSQQRLQVEY